MAQTTMQRQLSKKCTQCSRVRSARLRCEASAARMDIPTSWKLAPAVLAAVIAANTGAICADLIAPRPALADDTTEEENLTPYERRQRELERRRELLRQAREKAIQKAAAVDQQNQAATEQANQAVIAANESRSSEVTKLSSDLKSSASESYFNQASKRKLEPAASPPPSTPFWQSSTPAPAPTPTPAPVTPAPSASSETPWWETVSKTEPVKAPEPKAAVTKAPEPKPAPKPVEAKQGKRQGPLPGWFAQFVVLGALGGTAVAFTKYLDETTALLGKYTKDLEKALLELKVPNFGGNN